MKPVVSQTPQKGKANLKQLHNGNGVGQPRMTIGQLLIRLLDEGKRLPRAANPFRTGLKRAQSSSTTLPIGRICLMILAIRLFAAPAAAAVYYVDPAGDDSSAGSAEYPFRTLVRGVEAAEAGDTVIVRDGRYGPGNVMTGDDASENNQSPVILRKSGTPDAWITLRAENKWGATLDCEMRCDAYLNLYNASYVVIEGFVITNGYKEGIHSNDSAHHIVLRGNRIENIANRQSNSRLGLSGMYTNPNCHHFLIDGNVFRNIGRTNPGQLDHGLYLRGSDFTVTNNIFYNIPHGWSIQAADGLTNVLIAHNVFAFKNAVGRPGQIMLWKRQTNLRIQNNIFYEGERHAVTEYQASITSCAIDHNIVYGAPAVASPASGCSVGVNYIGASPMFVNPSIEPYDFHLRPGSPAIGAGVLVVGGVDADFDGLPRTSPAPDLGAFSSPRAQQ